MIIIYHDVGGAHSTAVAANIHINKLPIDRVPSKDELLALQTFDKIEKNQIGHLIYIGEDENKNRVFTVGRKYSPNILVPAITDLYSALYGNTNDLYIVNTKPTVNFLMNVGGFTSRKLHWVWFGRPIVTKGTQDAYIEIASLVKGVKDKINKKLYS